MKPQTIAQIAHGASLPLKLSRRRWLAATGAAIGAAAWPGHGTLARQATPAASLVGSPVAADRDWRSEQWVGTWAASPHVPGLGFGEIPSQLFEFDNQTVRQIVRISIGGDSVRVRLSNTFGDEPLVIGAARIALRDGDERIDPATNRVLTFSGSPTITIPAGALVLSDPVDLAAPALAELAVSVYLPEPASGATVHGLAFQTNYISPEGDFTDESAMPVDTTAQTWFFLTGIDVAVSEPTGAIVALGDSITDGAISTPDTNRRWPDVLAERLAADGRAIAVLNQGIGGNRLLHDSPPDLGLGPSALARFDRDVLAQPGVTHLIVFEGVNDIGTPIFADASEIVSAEQIIAGLRQIAERAHERGIIAYGATITPFAESYFAGDETEAMRQAVNDWIRTGGAFDAVIDFDAVVRDPDEPARLLADYDSGDHLHPNDAGFRAMGEAIDLSLFEPADAR